VIRKHPAVLAGLLVACIVVVGGQVVAAPPDDSDDEIEELAEAATEKWLRSQGSNVFLGTVACGVDSVSSQSVYCYAHTPTGIVALSAPIPVTPDAAWQFTMLAGSLGGSTEPIPTSTAPAPTDIVTTAAPTTTSPELATTTTVSMTSTFGEGLQVVNVDVLPGRYQAAGSDFCYWERLSDSTVDDVDAIIANAIVTGPVVADIRDTDVAFNSSGCGTWTFYTPPPAPVDSFGPGTYVVGSDIVPGTYEAPGGPDCYWRRLGGFSADFDELLAIENMVSTGQVVVEATDVGFTSSDCGTWTLVSDRPGSK
jgi:hypothetical protein